MQIKGSKSEGEISVDIDASDPPKILEFAERGR